MSTPSRAARPIFRAEVAAARAGPVARLEPPRIHASRTIALVWIAVAVLLAGGLLAWSAPVPLYVHGFGVVAHDADDAPSLIAFLPPETLAHRARVRELVLLSDRDRSVRVERIEPELATPLAIERRYGLGSAAIARLAGPACVAVAPLEPGDAIARAGTETVHEIEVRIGSRSALSLVPWIGGAFGVRESDDAHGEPSAERR